MEAEDKALRTLFLAHARAQALGLEPWRQLSDELNGRTSVVCIETDMKMVDLARYWWLFWEVAH